MDLARSRAAVQAAVEADIKARLARISPAQERILALTDAEIRALVTGVTKEDAASVQGVLDSDFERIIEASLPHVEDIANAVGEALDEQAMDAFRSRVRAIAWQESEDSRRVSNTFSIIDGPAMAALYEDLLTAEQRATLRAPFERLVG